MMDDKNKKKVVVITGVTRGLGRAMAEKFISLGHTVLGCGRNRQIIEEMRQKWPKRHDWDVVDVTREDQVMAWMERLHQKCGAPELLLNNAGVINRNAPLWKVPPHEFAQVMNVNVRGSYNVIRAFLPNMIKKHRGVVVNFSSGWGRAAEKEVGPYVASKWAIEGMTQALAMEMPEGLAVVSFDPGIINTDMLHSCFGMAAASHYPTPTRWAEKAVPFLLKLDATDNGHALNAPE